MYKKVILLCLIIALSGQLFAQRYQESDDFSYALKLYNEGYYDISAQQFSVFLNKYPGAERAADAKYYLAFSLFNLKEYSNARIEFQNLAVSYPENKRAAEAWLKVGDSYLKLKQFEEAARAFETVKVLYPGNVNAPLGLYKAADVYFKNRMFQKCKLTLQDFLDRYVENAYYPLARLLYARLLLQEQKFDLSKNEIEKVLEARIENETAAEALLVKSRLLEALGQIENAKSVVNKILQLYSKTAFSAPAVIRLSELHIKSRDYDDAIRLLNTEINKNRDSRQKIIMRLRLAAVNYIKGDYFSARRAMAQLPETLINDSLTVQKYFYLGLIYKGEKDYPQSITQFRQILDSPALSKAYPRYSLEAKKQLGILNLSAGNYDQGSDLVLAYLQESGNVKEKAELYSSIFNAALKTDRILAADRVYNQLLADRPRLKNRDILLYQLAKKYFDTGNYSRSKLLFGEISTEYYCSAKYDSTIHYLKLINYFYESDEGVGVNKLARLVGRMLSDSDTDNLRLELAKIELFQLKEAEEAIKICTALAETSKDSAVLSEAYHLKAEALRRLTLKDAHQADISLYTELEDAFKSAMSYIKFSRQPDSLAFGFLSTTVDEQLPLVKQQQYWRHFKNTYTDSKFSASADFILAQINLSLADTTESHQMLLDLTRSSQKQFAGDAYCELARIAKDNNDAKKETEYLKEFLLEIPKHPKRAIAYNRLAGLYLSTQDYKTAAAFYERLNQEYNYSDAGKNAYSQIPASFFAAGNYQRVLELTENEIQGTKHSDPILNYIYSPENIDLYYLNGAANYKMGQKAKGRSRIYEYIHAGNNDRYHENALMTMAEIEIENEEYSSALLHLRAITANAFSQLYVQASAKIADIYFKQNKFAESRKIYLELILKSKDPDQIRKFRKQELFTYINQGQFKTYETKLKAFKNAYKNQAGLNEDLANFDFELGKYYYKKKNFDRAIKKFERIGKKYKKTTFADDAYYYLGLTYTTLNRTEKAQEILSGFMEKYPGSPVTANVYITLGNLYYRGEKSELAVDAFRKAVEFAGERDIKKIALGNLIKLYRDLGLWDGVLSQSRDYVQNYPKAEDVVDKRILIGSALINLNRYSEAVAHLKKVKLHANSEQEPEIQFYIGEAYYNGGQYENAIREFVKIPLLSRQTKLQWEASALYFSGQSYEKLGRIDDAIRMYQEIVDRPGIIVDLKREARKKIQQLKKS